MKDEDKLLMGLTGSAAILFGIVMFIAPGDGALVLLGLIAAFSLVLGSASWPSRSAGPQPGRSAPRRGTSTLQLRRRRTHPDQRVHPLSRAHAFICPPEARPSSWRRTTLLPVSASGEYALHAGSGIAGHMSPGDLQGDQTAQQPRATRAATLRCQSTSSTRRKAREQPRDAKAPELVPAPVADQRLLVAARRHRLNSYRAGTSPTDSSLARSPRNHRHRAPACHRREPPSRLRAST